MGGGYSICSLSPYTIQVSSGYQEQTEWTITTCIGFEVLVVVSTKTAALWNVILCSVVYIAHLRQQCHNSKFGIFELLV